MRSLIRKSTANMLVRSGARIQPLGYCLSVAGIGASTVQATHQLVAQCHFDDGKNRVLVAAICDDCIPYELVVGLDFMTTEGVSFEPVLDGFVLRDCRLESRPRIYDSSSTQIYHFGRNRSFVCSATAVPKKIGRKGFRKFAEKWNSLPQADRNLVHTLATVQLADITQDELVSRLSSIVSATEGGQQAASVSCSASTTTNDTERLTVPPCDFPEHQRELEDLVNEFRDVFSTASSDVGQATGPTATIRLAREGVVNLKNYRTPLKLKPILEKLVQDLLSAGIIEPCDKGGFNSPCLLVPKKAEPGTNKGDLYRLVVDYRALNKLIHNVVFPIPRLQDIFAEYRGCTVFSSCDIRHAFYTIGLDVRSRHLTAFSCELGKFQFRFLPQGLKISPAVFQSQISKDLDGLVRTKPYIDDILSGDPTVPVHLSNLRALFLRLRAKGYKLKLAKCLFLKKKVTHLGTDISENGLSIPQDKVQAVHDLRKPTTQAEIKSLLGFTNFLRDKVPCYSDVVHPIQSLLSIKPERCQGKEGNIEGYWTSKHDDSLSALKDMLTRPTVLSYPCLLYTSPSPRDS